MSQPQPQPPFALAATAQVPPPERRARWPLALAAGLAIGALLGIAITFAVTGSDPDTETPARPATAGPETGHLEVTSVPGDGTVTVDGRLVGLTPIDRLDLDPGRHALVIEAFGYQPYAGTITIEAGGGASLEAHLAELGADTRSSGQWRGSGSHQARPVPTPSAAAPGSTAPAPTPSAKQPATSAKKKKKSRPRDDYEPPARDCSGERSSCRSACDDAEFSCTSRCQYCGSCVTSMTWDECNRICNTCKQGCEQNLKFCESSCENRYDSCR